MSKQNKLINNDKGEGSDLLSEISLEQVHYQVVKKKSQSKSVKSKSANSQKDSSDDMSLQNSVKSKKSEKSEKSDKSVQSNLKNNNVWKHIFKEIKYDGKSDIIVTANQIKGCKKTWTETNNQFEPRLLCKQDSNTDRPEIFKENGLCIIAVKNGEYLLTKNSIYYDLVYPKTKIIEINKNDDSVLLNIGNSETSLIDNLRYSGLFEKKQYLGEPILYGSLLNGRHRCTFETKIGNKTISICGAQFETDACYESKNKILLIEGKSVNDVKSFNIRQLYYPYRTIYDVVKDKKEIISLFINRDKKGIIHIWKFQFENPLVMTSIKSIGYNAYEFD